ncbi:MAG: polyisoprenoid-binding protein [Burkholderiales bacterium RIFOXYC2_FULL_59_8]|nr:MAG: polyisoprenoid-binding protein [Burkholderiales bacterium RIFOXYC2_FULL_59_8]OGB54223.1 MAG: polyisoprenoid-binding protein [Burkholderiales bacterium RIFOXYD12_FULL_59_19]OGB72464.1 MAG: polyisoprenoid-binding protein [Burkholderiales bacterium RIFOXYC12_FULL_60_6]
MNTRHLASALLAASLAAIALPAAAQQKLLPAQSSIAFEIKQMGVPVQGHFKKFDAQVNFAATKLTSSKVNFTVDIASTTLGAPEMDSELPKATWFNTAKFPQAQFTSSGFKALGGGKYEVTGKLAIKGQSRDVTVPLTMTQAGATTTASGVLPIKRLAFKIGEGDWADTSMVADDVQVKFKLALSGIPKLP